MRMYSTRRAGIARSSGGSDSDRARVQVRVVVEVVDAKNAAAMRMYSTTASAVGAWMRERLEKGCDMIQ